MPASSAFISAVNRQLEEQLSTIYQLASYPEVRELVDPLLNFTAGGKRGRAKLVALGTQLAGKTPNSDTIHAATALEFFQAFALIHDDIIDHAATRRGNPALHCAYAQQMGTEIGISAAILAGDLMMGLADREVSAITPNQQFLREWANMCTEVAFGQYLDTRFEASTGHDTQRSLSVVRSKSANYSVVYPLVLGYILAGADPEAVANLKAATLPLGEAFQLRDDYLGVCGDETLTGKPSGCDISEGKKTVLLSLFANARPNAPELEFVGKELTTAQLTQFRKALAESGALATHEQMIAARWEEFVTALADLPLAADAAADLVTLGKSLVERDA